MMYWNPIVMAVCSVLLLFLLWKELRRRNTTWLPARVIATIAAVAGLVALALPLSYTTKINGNGAPAAVLLTEGYSPDSLKTFLQKNGTLPVYSLIKSPVTEGAIYLPNAVFLKKDINRFNQVHVFGNGLNEDELSTLKNVPILFHPSPAKKGIISISWNQELVLGNKLKIQGYFINDNIAPAKIILNGFDVPLDSCNILAKGATTFQLQTVPKHLDLATYSIIVVSGTDTLEEEPVPMNVTAPKPIKVLLLAAYPDFENKFLKNWLAQSGYPVVARTRISKDKFTKDYENVTGSTINSITSSFLNQFDVIIADAAELSTISGGELAAIQSAVSQQGLGLIVKMDSGTTSRSFWGSSFPLLPEKGKTMIPTKLHFTNDSSSNTLILKTAQPLYIREIAGTQPLVQTEKGQTVISSKLQGIGKIVATAISNTYTWQLGGNEKSYSSFWANLLQQAVKKQEQPESFTTDPALPVTNEKLTIHLQTAFSEPPQVVMEAEAISMEQNYQLPFMWKGFYWPYRQGWVPVNTSHQTLEWIYVYGKDDWKNVRAESKKKDTKIGVDAHSSSVLQSRLSEKLISTEVPKIYFFLLFLLSASFLWFEKKYLNR